MKYYYSVIIAVCLICFMSCKQRVKINAESGLPEIEVEEPIIDSILLTQEFEGRLSMGRQIDIVAKVDGILKEVHVDSFQNVVEGQLLYTILNSKYDEGLKIAKMAAERAQKEKEKITLRLENLQKKSSKTTKIDTGELNNIQEELNKSIGKIKAAIENVKSAQLMVELCQIKAPFAGIISGHKFSKGDEINGEKEPVVMNTIGNDKVLQADISLSLDEYERLLALIEKYDLKFDKVPLKAPTKNIFYYSELIDSLPSPESSSKRHTISFRIDNSFDVLESGTEVKIVLPSEVLPQALLIKDRAIRKDNNGEFLYTLNTDNRIIYTPIQVGDLYQDSLRVVISGIDTKTRYVTDDAIDIKEGIEIYPLQ